MKSSDMTRIAKELAAKLRTNEAGFKARAEKESSGLMHASFNAFASKNAQEAAAVEKLIEHRAALYTELKNTADKLSWLREAVKTERVISAEDLTVIRRQLIAARKILFKFSP